MRHTSVWKQRFLGVLQRKRFLVTRCCRSIIRKRKVGKIFTRLRRTGSIENIITPRVETQDQTGSAGTLSETLDANARWAKRLDDDYKQKVLQEAETLKHANLIRKLEQKLRFVKNTALSLESESEGVLVSVDKVSKGYAIIVFRGHDYKCPSALRPKNLLTKRKALARSIELQRREALLNHISTLHSRISKMQYEIV
ncbi:hypothetical protein L1987_09120 [Smallanthus sonchifolius]|uniref:Uncharacterized protein n=1 Tax=Smallanthus sonchifolius TaxID=185202 RepID=A0ACB9JN28_9ASTR|nr:hypothetical protein L1987_09120 [Smallanthus sonchifolius]